MIINVHHYRVRRGIRLLDIEMPDWREGLRGCDVGHVQYVLDALREKLPWPHHLEAKTQREIETLKYVGLLDTDPTVWLEFMDVPVPVTIVPMGPPLLETTDE